VSSYLNTNEKRHAMHIVPRITLRSRAHSARTRMRTRPCVLRRSEIFSPQTPIHSSVVNEQLLGSVCLRGNLECHEEEGRRASQLQPLRLRRCPPRRRNAGDPRGARTSQRLLRHPRQRSVARGDPRAARPRQRPQPSRHRQQRRSVVPPEGQRDKKTADPKGRCAARRPSGSHSRRRTGTRRTHRRAHQSA